MRILYIDPVGGLAGDMILGALVDLGWDLDSLRRELATLGLRDIVIEEERREHHGIATRGIVVKTAETHVHRALPDIEKILGMGVEVPPHRARALDVFRRLVNAEAKIHGRPVERVHLHEVGAQDAIADILGTCLALDDLGIERVYAGTPRLGSGMTTSSHGPIPIPAPATLEILRGVAVEWTNEAGEKVTPTGAALVATLASAFGAPPPMTASAIGWGGGTRPSTPGMPPNTVRVVLGDSAAPPARPSPDEAAGVRATSTGAGASWETVAVLTCNIDDMTPAEAGHLGSLLLAAGALDFHFSQGLMKKGRPGWSLCVLAHPDHETIVRDVLLTHSSTIGVRSRIEARWVLPRRAGSVDTRYGTVRVKWVRRGEQWSAEPEFESAREVAEAAQVTLREVADEARRSAAAQEGQEPHF